jgi:hypothetical protein
MYSGGHEDKLSKLMVKADGVQQFGRQQTWMRQGEHSGHHRGLRPGHVLKGVARELGRARKPPCESTRKMRGTGRSRALAFTDLLSSVSEPKELRRETQIKGARKVSGEESEERTNLRRAFGSLSGT